MLFSDGIRDGTATTKPGYIAERIACLFSRSRFNKYASQQLFTMGLHSRMPPAFLLGGGEMGSLMRSMDWSLTSLGDSSTWPSGLRSALSICLGSGFPIGIYWGSELALLYNDAWSPIPGNKHPWALGRPAHEVWPEIWDTIGPLFHHVVTTGEATRSKDELLPMRRHGYTEECYFDYTFTPIRGEDGSVEGVFNAVIETTYRVINERRARTLQELIGNITTIRTEEEVYEAAARILGEAVLDIPFLMLYNAHRTEKGYEAQLLSFAGISPAEVPDMASIALGTEDTASAWPFNRVAALGHSLPVGDIDSRYGIHPRSPWPEPCREALIVPLGPASGNTTGFLVAGISPRRLLDKEYQNFIESVAAHVANAIANARAYAEERKRAEALAEVDRAKTIFFSNISHEFRTPLTLMLGPLEDILNHTGSALPRHVVTNVEAAHRNAIRLLRLVNTLLDFSRIEAGRMQARYQPVDLASYTTDLAGSFRSVIEKAGMELQLQCYPLPQPVYVDVTMWEKIVLNLLSNAFKYTLRGRITVTLAEEDGNAVLRVQDTGVGIPAKELPHMFERFHRIQNVTGRTHEGTGIGLSLVHELVKLHQGRITIDSKEGEGSTFAVTIPLGRTHLPEAQIVETQAAGHSTEQSNPYVQEAVHLIESSSRENEQIAAVDDEQIAAMDDEQKLSPATGSNDAVHKKFRIVVVDDNADMRSYFSHLLDREYIVETASDGSIGLEKVRKLRPDLVISDIMMPVMDGVQLLHAIKNDPETAVIPVILLSARAGEEAKIEGYEAGADDYLVKPFSARELLARVRSQIRIARIRSATEIQLRTLFSQAPVAIAIFHGPSFVIELANEKILELWGREAAEVMYKPLFDALPEIQGQEFGNILTSVYTTGEKYLTPEYRIRLLRRGQQEEIYVSFILEALRDDTDTITSVMVVAHDVTDLVLARTLAQLSAVELEKKVAERTSELRDSNRQLEKSNYDLEQFAYIASHDLQEPLRKIQTFAELLRMNLHDNEATVRYFDKIDSSVKRMTTLIRDVLDYSRLSQTGEQYRDVSLNNILEQVRADFEIPISRQQAVLQYEQLPSVRGLPMQLQQLFSNLISNSLKFSQQTPVIRIIAAPASAVEKEHHPELDPALDYIRLDFQDNGIGFEQQYARQIFTIFQRLNNRQAYGGTGIGLAICKKIIENHRGAITAHSEPDKGTTFTMYLPSAGR